MRAQTLTWTCSVCIWKILPFSCSNSASSETELDVSYHSSSSESDKVEQLDPLQDFVCIKQSHSRRDLLVHQNTNSLQNKFEELEFINDKIKASVTPFADHLGEKDIHFREV